MVTIVDSSTSVGSRRIMLYCYPICKFEEIIQHLPCGRKVKYPKRIKELKNSIDYCTTNSQQNLSTLGCNWQLCGNSLLAFWQLVSCHIKSESCQDLKSPACVVFVLLFFSNFSKVNHCDMESVVHRTSRNSLVIIHNSLLYRWRPKNKYETE